MEDFRSKSCRDGRMKQMEGYNNGAAAPTSMQDLRCYSANYASYMGKEATSRRGKGSNSHHHDYGSSSSYSSLKSWSFSDPELQRKKRVAGYKVYAVEGKMKGSFRKSFRWIKNTYTQVVHGGR